MENVNISIKTILRILEENNFSFEYYGDQDLNIGGFSDPGEYHAGTAIWLGSLKYLKMEEEVKSSHDVTLVFANVDLEDLQTFPNRIIIDDPRNSFMLVVEKLFPQERLKGIETSAIVSNKAVIGRNVYIGHYTVIEEDVEVGDDTIIESHCIIKKGTTIGKSCYIGEGCILGHDGFGFRKVKDEGYVRLPHLCGLKIGEHVEIYPGCIIDRGTFRDTLIGNYVKIDSVSRIGHNVKIEDNCLIIASTIGGNNYIQENCEIIGSRTKNRIIIGSDTKVGIGSIVMKDIPEKVICAGNPARVIGYK